MRKPDTIHKCPVCDYEGEIKPYQKKFEHARIIGTKKGKWWSYKCKCGFEFSTTQSDTISMEQWNKQNAQNEKIKKQVTRKEEGGSLF